MPSNAGDDEQADGAAEVRLTETDVQEILNPGEVPGLPPLEAANIEGAADSQDSQDNHQDTPLAEAAGTMASLADDDNAGAMDVDDDDRKPPALPAAEASPEAPIAKAVRSAVTFRSDLTKASRGAHNSGVLHATRLSRAGREEHCFAWVANVSGPGHLDAALAHLGRYGFARPDVVFVPYSTRSNWCERYPLAYPHILCDGDGRCSGAPYWSGGGGAYASAAAVPAAAGPGQIAVTADGLVAPSSGGARPRGRALGARRARRMIPNSNLPQEERDVLHVEVYRYLTWLQRTLDAADGVEAAAVGGSAPSVRRAVSNSAGVSPANLTRLISAMEDTFRCVRAAVPQAEAEAAGGAGGEAPPAPAAAAPRMPFLEGSLGDPLGRLADAARAEAESAAAASAAARDGDDGADPPSAAAAGSARRGQGKRSRGLDFEVMFGRLLAFKEEHGHVNVPQKFAGDPQLGSWVANIRSKRKAMAKDGVEHEPDPGAPAAPGSPSEPARPGRKGGRQRLTKDRVRRLDDAGFAWSIANPNNKTWEERFEDLRDYQQQHGTTRVPRSSGTLGEWVHMQRRLHNKRERNFMAKKAPLLDSIGFEWHPRKHSAVSWDDNFQRLVEFGRVHQHYAVVSPFPEGTEPADADANPEAIEAHRFYRWVRRIQAEYRNYSSGKQSRMLSEARVMQLRGIGFQFEESV